MDGFMARNVLMASTKRIKSLELANGEKTASERHKVVGQGPYLIHFIAGCHYLST